MGFQYDKEDRETALEKKYYKLIEEQDNHKEQLDKKIEQVLERNLDITLDKKIDPNLKPNKYFIEEYKKRKAREEKEADKEKFLSSIDETGNKIAKVYNIEEFHKLHDPLNLYAKKGNYESLAWKVFYDVEDTDCYLKTLYYPKLRNEDYGDLLTKFSSEYSSFLNKRKFTALMALFGGGAGIALAYRFSFKLKTSLVMSLFLFGVTWYQMSYFSQMSMNKNLNKFAKEIAIKYPEIKFTEVEYGKINH